MIEMAINRTPKTVVSALSATILREYRLDCLPRLLSGRFPEVVLPNRNAVNDGDRCRIFDQKEDNGVRTVPDGHDFPIGADLDVLCLIDCFTECDCHGRRLACGVLVLVPT